MNDIYIIVDVVEDGEMEDPLDVANVGYKYETYKTLEGAQAGADEEFKDKSKYEIWKLGAQKVGP